MFEITDWAQFSKGIGIGLFAGLLVASLIWFRSLLSSRGLRKQKEGEVTALKGEIKQMQDHLHTQMKITSKGNENLEKDNETLKKTNENLRIENSSLRQKPGRQEIRQFEVYERAIQKMNGRAPGFAPAWQAALAEAEEEQKEAESGVVGFVRKIFRGTGSTEAGSRNETPTLEMRSSSTHANGSKGEETEKSDR